MATRPGFIMGAGFERALFSARLFVAARANIIFGKLCSRSHSWRFFFKPVKGIASEGAFCKNGNKILQETRNELHVYSFSSAETPRIGLVG